MQDETERLRRLEDLGIVDTPPDRSFDNIVELASLMLDAPIALVSIVDRHRQWFKARVGLPVAETDRASSFCAHAIETPDEVFTVDDASVDPRFAGNPLVLGDPRIRFYAGAPIVMSSGTVPGTLCIVDTKPRSLDGRQLNLLRVLARQVAALLDLHERTLQAESLAVERDRLLKEGLEEKRAAKELLEFVLRGGDLGMWDLDVTNGTWTINSREAEMLGYTSDEAQREVPDWKSLVHPDDLSSLQAENARHFRGETPFSESKHRIRQRDGSYVWVLDRSVAVQRNESGRPTRIVGTHMDVTERKRLEDRQRQATERLELALSGGNIGLWDRDLQTGRTVYNDEWWSLFGFEASERKPFDGLWKSLVHPDDYDAARDALRKHIDGHSPMYVGELRARHGTGEYLWLQNRAKVVERGADGAAVRIVGITMNITESKLVQDALAEERRRLRLVTDNLPALVTYVDRDERYTFANAFVERVFGVPAQAMIGRTMREIRGEQIYAGIAPHVQAALEGREVQFEGSGEANGRHYHYQSNYIPDVAQDGAVLGFYAMTFDVTRQKVAELRSAENEQRLRGITDNVPVLIAELDADWRFRFCNGTYQAWLGVSPEALLGRPVAEALGDAIYQGRHEYLARAYAGERVTFEQLVELKSGERALQTTYVPRFDGQGGVVGVYALTSDVTTLKDQQRQLDALARTDPLTGLANRRTFEERVVDAMARSRRSGEAIAVMYVDLDHFKAINDANGHGTGDEVLREFARRLERNVRKTDLVARYAGDEFVIVLEAVRDAGHAGAVGQKILKSMTEAFDVGVGRIAVTASIGLALFSGADESRADESATALLARADAALYKAKDLGRNRLSTDSASGSNPPSRT